MILAASIKFKITYRVVRAVITGWHSLEEGGHSGLSSFSVMSSRAWGLSVFFFFWLSQIWTLSLALSPPGYKVIALSPELGFYICTSQEQNKTWVGNGMYFLHILYLSRRGTFSGESSDRGLFPLMGFWSSWLGHLPMSTLGKASIWHIQFIIRQKTRMTKVSGLLQVLIFSVE